MAVVDCSAAPKGVANATTIAALGRIDLPILFECIMPTTGGGRDEDSAKRAGRGAVSLAADRRPRDGLGPSRPAGLGPARFRARLRRHHPAGGPARTRHR